METNTRAKVKSLVQRKEEEGWVEIYWHWEEGRKGFWVVFKKELESRERLHGQKQGACASNTSKQWYSACAWYLWRFTDMGNDLHFTDGETELQKN